MRTGNLRVRQTPGQNSWEVGLPSWRLDLEREIDLIEEVARVYGYNRFANTLPAIGEGVRALPWAEKEATVRGTLLAAGFHEAIASTFCSAAEGALTAPQPGLVVPLGNPLSEEAGVLRPSLVPGMLTMIAGNLNRDVSDVRLFELGTVFSGHRRATRWTSARRWPLALWALCRRRARCMPAARLIFLM